MSSKLIPRSIKQNGVRAGGRRSLDVARLFRFFALRGSAAGRAAAHSRRSGGGAGGPARLVAGMLGCRRVLFAREFAVGVLVQLVEILFVRRAFHLLAGEVAVLVLVQGLEHLFGAAGFRGAGARGARGAGGFVVGLRGEWEGKRGSHCRSD